MSIPFSELVNIQPRTIGGGYNSLEFNGLLISTSASLPTNAPVAFNTASSVAEYFGAGSDEYSLAVNYFAGNTVATKRPSTLYFSRFINSSASGWLRGAEYVGSITDLRSIDNGTLIISIDGEEQTVNDIDLSGASNFSAVAGAITIPGATVSWNTQFNAFVVTSNTQGTDSIVSFASGTVADALNLTANDGAIISQGANVETLTEHMNSLVNNTQNFVSFMPVFQEDATQALALANWCNAQGTRFIYAYTETSNSVTLPQVSSFAQQTADYYGVACQYNTKAVSSALMGFIASIDWASLNGRMIMAFRQQGGLLPTVTNKDTARNLIANGYNFYGGYANPNNEDNFFQNGQISGPAKWIDTYCGQIYLANQLQIAWVNIMKNRNTIPYNADGYATLRVAAQDPILSAVNNGVIVRGVTLSNSQIATVVAEAGLDISTELQTQGYYLQILDPSAEVRANRGTPIIKLWYTDGGSVQKIEASATTIL